MRSDEDFARTLAAMDEYRGMLPCVMLVVSFVPYRVVGWWNVITLWKFTNLLLFPFVDLDDMLIL